MTKKYLLNLGLAFTLLYAGISALVTPSDWVGFVPAWVTSFGLSRELALHAHSAAEILLGAGLLFNYRVKIVAGLAALDMLAILLAGGFSASVFLITFRDVGLFLAALYLAVA